MMQMEEKTGSLILKTCYGNLDVNIFGETKKIFSQMKNEQYIQIFRNSVVKYYEDQ